VIPREVERLRAFQAQAADQAPDLFAPAISHDTVARLRSMATAYRCGHVHGRHAEQSAGRLGDSSLIGCGCYADNESAAASLTGWESRS